MLSSFKWQPVLENDNSELKTQGLGMEQVTSPYIKKKEKKKEKILETITASVHF